MKKNAPVRRTCSFCGLQRLTIRLDEKTVCCKEDFDDLKGRNLKKLKGVHWV